MNDTKLQLPRLSGPGTESEERSIHNFENEGGPGINGPLSVTPDATAQAGANFDQAIVVVFSTDPVTDGFFAHHRHIPELRVGGASPAMAVANLLQHLTTQIDSIPDRERREFFIQIHKDVQAFAARCV